jgi:hypothetical protein
MPVLKQVQTTVKQARAPGRCGNPGNLNHCMVPRDSSLKFFLFQLNREESMTGLDAQPKLGQWARFARYLIPSLALIALLCMLAASRSLGRDNRSALSIEPSAYNPEDFQIDTHEPTGVMDSKSVLKVADRLDSKLGDLEKRTAYLKKKYSGPNKVQITMTSRGPPGQKGPPGERGARGPRGPARTA